MASHPIQYGTPGILHEERFAMNGDGPEGVAFRRIANGINTTSARLRKVELAAIEFFNSVPSGGAGTADWWRAFMRTGEDCAGIVHYVGLAKSDYASADNPRVTIANVNIGSGATLSTTSIPYASRTTTSDVNPEDVHHVASVVTGVASDTEYGFLMSRISGGRPVYWAIGELGSGIGDDTGDSIVNPAPYLDGGPIYYQDIREVHQKLTTIKKHNAVHLFNWSWDGTSSMSRTANTYGPAITTVGASPPNAATFGWSVDLTGHGTLLKNVPITFYGRARTSSGTTNNIRLVDQAGNAIVTLSGFTTGTAQWKTGTGTTSESTTRLHVEFKSDGAATFEMFGCGAYEYAT